jgi:hypothetical protein
MVIRHMPLIQIGRAHGDIFPQPFPIFHLIRKGMVEGVNLFGRPVQTEQLSCRCRLGGCDEKQKQNKEPQE